MKLNGWSRRDTGVADQPRRCHMRTPATRKQHIRKTNRYQRDLTDEEWPVINPRLPVAKSTERPRAWPRRADHQWHVYVMGSGCPWRLLPSDLPPWRTVYRWFAKLRDEGCFEKLITPYARSRPDRTPI